MPDAEGMDLDRLTANLVRDPRGIWVSTARADISYPQEGNDLCFGLEDASYWFRHRNECITTMLQLFPPAGTFLDVGGGNGFVALALQDKGFDVVMVEPGAAGADNARQRGIHHIICSTLEDAHFPPGSVPAIGLFDVVEHVGDAPAFLKSVRRSLVSGGRIYVTVPAYDALWSADDVSAGHVRRYTLTRIRDELNESGFAFEFGSYLFSMLPLPIFLLRTIPSKLRRRTVLNKHEMEQGHRLPRWPLGGLLSRMLKAEVSMLRRKRSIPFGGSCLVVGRKRSDER